MKKIFLIIFILFAAAVYAEDSYPTGSQLNIDGSALGWDDTAKKWRPVAVDANGNLKTDSGGTTQEISVDTSNIESYLKEVDGEDTITITDLINGIGTDTSNIESYLKKIDGNDTTTITDFIEEIRNCLKVSISPYNYSIIDRLIILVSNSEAIKDKLNKDDVETLYTQRKSITANTATSIGYLKPSPTSSDHRTFIELRAVDSSKEFYIGFDSSVTDSTGRPVKARILINIDYSQSIYIYHTDTSDLAIQQTEGWN